MPAELKRRALSIKQKRKHNFSLGERGEKVAAGYLAARGMVILERNYRTGKGQGGGCEIDIIGLEGEELVFVEVKTRMSEEFGAPTLAINRGKMAQIAKAAEYFRKQRAEYRDCDYRVDAVGVVMKKGAKPEILHYENVTWLV